MFRKIVLVDFDKESIFFPRINWDSLQAVASEVVGKPKFRENRQNFCNYIKMKNTGWGSA